MISRSDPLRLIERITSSVQDSFIFQYVLSQGAKSQVLLKTGYFRCLKPPNLKGLTANPVQGLF